MSATINLQFGLSPEQRSFVESKKPWTAFIGGVGSGKTHAGAIRSIIAAVQEPGSLGVIAAPTFTMMKDVTQRKFFELMPPPLQAAFNKNDQALRLVNGSEILFRSMDDPDRIRGINAAWFWLDEGPLAGYYSWLMLKQRAGRQDATKYRRQGWITGTPKGRDGFHSEFVKNPTDEHFIVQVSTHANKRHLPENYIEGMGLTGAFYNQEILGSFEAFSGLVYKLVEAYDEDGVPLPQSHVIDEPPKGKRFKRVVGGIDWGFANPAVALVIGIDGEDRAWLLDEFYARYQELDRQIIPQVVEFTEQYGVEKWWCDAEEPEHIQKLNNKLSDLALDCEAVAADKAISSGIQTVQFLMSQRADGRPGFFVCKTCPNTIREFGSYQYDKRPGLSEEQEQGDVVNERPRKQSDHAMDALRYPLHNELGNILPAMAFRFARSISPDDLAKMLIKKQAERDPEDDDFLFQRRQQSARSLRWLVDKAGGSHDPTQRR